MSNKKTNAIIEHKGKRLCVQGDGTKEDIKTFLKQLEKEKAAKEQKPD
jgi:hypothetical protein